MKYNTLKNDIVNILHSNDYNLFLKFYDENGNTTLNPNEADWCYIQNNNVMVKFMANDNPNILFLKDNKSADNDFKNIIQRIRQLCLLNGVSVQIRVYDDLNQRKIYNFVKNNIIQNKQEEKMNESVNEKVNNIFFEIISGAKNVKRMSDFYMAESISNIKNQNLLKEMISEIKSFKAFKKINLEESFKDLLTCTSKKDLCKLSESLNDKVKKHIIENQQNILNIVKYVQNKYLNNVELKTDDKPTSIIFMENVKVYPYYENDSKELAYNIIVDNNPKSYNDIVRTIKNNNLCETYHITRQELYNMCNENSLNKIMPHKSYILETSNGERIKLDEKLTQGLKMIAKYINDGGYISDSLCQNIMAETYKFNDLYSFVKENKDSYKLKKYVDISKKLIKECLNNLHSNNYNCFNTKVDISYENELKDIISECKINHPALKYIAESIAYENTMKAKIIIESNMNDLNILTKGLKPYCKSLKELQTLVESIMKHKVKLNESIEVVDKNNIVECASKLYKEICLENDFNKLKISSALFNIIHSNNQNKNNIEFINCLRKYIG